MPYIHPDRRPLIKPMSERTAADAGELNFQLTHLLIKYLLKHRHSYQTINDIIGALEGTKAEFYRRIVMPYEEQKIIINGDVYPNE